jgi:hypothetical protein
MKHLALILFAVPMAAQTLATITETQFRQSQQSALFVGKIEVAPARNCRLTRDGVSYSFTRRVYCIGVTGGDCDTPTAAGVVSIQLVPTGPGTIPLGCFYTARITPTKGDVDTETWVIPNAQTYQIKDVRTTIAPTPSSIIRRQQLLGTDVTAGCATWSASGELLSTGVPCGTGSGGGVTPGGATWGNITTTWGTTNKTWGGI